MNDQNIQRRRAVLTVSAGVLSLLTATSGQSSLSISNRPSKNVDCSAGTCTATAAHAILNAGDLTNLLATGDVVVVAGKQARDISLDAAVSWVSSSRLTLDARRSVLFNNTLTVAGTGSLTIETSNGGAAGGHDGSRGGLVGLDDSGRQGTFADDYWDTETSGCNHGVGGDPNQSGVTGLTTAQLQAGLPAGFDPNVWAENSGINNGFPYLLRLPPN